MNVKEGVDLVKMAVTCMLVSLVISAGMGIWYLVFGAEQKLQKSMDDATNSAAMERLYELQDTSHAARNGSGQYPLVTNVVNALNEFNEQDLLFIYVDVATLPTPTSTSFTYSLGDIFTYEGVTLTSLDTSGLKSVPAAVKTSHNPMSQASRKLLVYSSRRCFIEMFETPYGDMAYTGIRITVIDEDLQ